MKLTLISYGKNWIEAQKELEKSFSCDKYNYSLPIKMNKYNYTVRNNKYKFYITLKGE